VAISNSSFDPANANRMMQVRRSDGSKQDTFILTLGCLGLSASASPYNVRVAKALCDGWADILKDTSHHFVDSFHQRDYIYMLRQIQRESLGVVSSMFTTTRILRAIERNFSGVPQDKFASLVGIFFRSLVKADESLSMPEPAQFRGSIELLHEALSPPQAITAKTETSISPSLMDQMAKIRPRFKLLLDPTDDDSSYGLLFDFGLLKPEDTVVIHMSLSPSDDSELYRVQLLSKIKYCMEKGLRVSFVKN